MSAYGIDFHETECMSVLMKDKEVLQNIIKFWEKFSNISKKEFNSEPIHNKKHLKAEKGL